jgi:hypothetical protein
MEVRSQLHTLMDLLPEKEEADWVLESVWKRWRREKVLYSPLLGIEIRSFTP